MDKKADWREQEAEVIAERCEELLRKYGLPLGREEHPGEENGRLTVGDIEVCRYRSLYTHERYYTVETYRFRVWVNYLPESRAVIVFTTNWHVATREEVGQCHEILDEVWHRLG